MMCRVVQKTALAVKRGLVYFFFDADAFRFKGIMWFSFQLLGLLGVLISTQFLSRPAIRLATLSQ